MFRHCLSIIASFALVSCGGSGGSSDVGVADAAADMGAPDTDSTDTGTDDTGTDDTGTDDGSTEDATGDADVGPGTWTAIAVTRATEALTIGDESFPVRGSASEWLPIVALSDTPDEVAWVAGVGFSGTVSSHGVGLRGARAAIDADAGDVYVMFQAHPVDGPDPMTIEVSGPDGSVGATSTTFANVEALGAAATYTESFVAKLDANGEPQWIKRLAQGSGDAEATTTIGSAINADGARLMINLNTNNISDITVGTTELTIAPGDPGEVVYDLPTNHRTSVTMLLDHATGEVQAVDILGDRTTNYGGVDRGWVLPTAAMIYDGVNERYAASSGVSNFQTTNVAYSLEGGTAVGVPQPGAGGYRAIWGTYAASDLSVEMNQAAVGNVSSDASRFVYPLADGGMLVSAQIASTVSATFSSSAGSQVQTGGQDATGWLALYDSDEQLVWAKPALAGVAGDAVCEWYSAVDDATDDAFFVYGAIYGSDGVTLGSGETGEVTFTVSPGLQHGVVARFDRSTGELAWARLLEQTSTTPTIPLTGALFRGADDTLDLRLAASGDVEIAGASNAFGDGASWVRVVFDETGTVDSSDVMLTATDLVVGDLMPES